jgi:hypothetical protein
MLEITQVKVDIQLYKVESNNYLVDFKNATPQLRIRSQTPLQLGESGQPEPDIVIGLSSFAFFDACSRLITELAIQG